MRRKLKKKKIDLQLTVTSTAINAKRVISKKQTAGIQKGNWKPKGTNKYY